MGKIYKALEKSELKTDESINSESFEYEKEDFKEEDGLFAEKRSVSGHLITANRPHSIESEQFRLLKNKILFPDSGTPPRTIMITSTDKGEGKSFVASNLAVTIAASLDDYVLLIDSDLRNPSIHSFFGFENKKGLSDYLLGKTELKNLLVKTFLDKLTILPGGETPMNPSELVSSEYMKKMIKEVESRYDDRYVIIDSPPPYMTSEANALATYVDGVIIVVKQGYTRKNRLKDLVDIYGKEKIIGVVKNFSTGLFGAGYGYDTKYSFDKN